MSTSQKKDQSKKLSIAVAQAKPMLAAVMGAVIGCGASLHLYYTLLGGAEQNRRLAQVESTVEHNRLVSEEALDLLKQMRTEASEHTVQGDAPLSRKPTQRELSDALDGLFEKLPDTTELDLVPVSTAPESVPAPSEPANAEQQPLGNNGSQSVGSEGSEGSEGKVAASSEAEKN